MDSTVRRSQAVFLLGAASLALGGCIASIAQERIEGPARPAMDAQAVVVTQRRPLSAPGEGQGEDAAPAECREVQVTGPMVRDVDLRRSFADDAQEKNAVLLALTAAGIGFLAYGANVAHCPQCFDMGPVQTEGYAALGLAAIPLAFLVINAMRVQDRHVTELAPTEARTGPWHACADARARR